MLYLKDEIVTKETKIYNENSNTEWMRTIAGKIDIIQQ